jgi:hypothetical protein
VCMTLLPSKIYIAPLVPQTTPSQPPNLIPPSPPLTSTHDPSVLLPSLQHLLCPELLSLPSITKSHSSFPTAYFYPRPFCPPSKFVAPLVPRTTLLAFYHPRSHQLSPLLIHCSLLPRIFWSSTILKASS